MCVWCWYFFLTWMCKWLVFSRCCWEHFISLYYGCTAAVCYSILIFIIVQYLEWVKIRQSHWKFYSKLIYTYLAEVLYDKPSYHRFIKPWHLCLSYVKKVYDKFIFRPFHITVLKSCTRKIHLYVVTEPISKLVTLPYFQ